MAKRRPFLAQEQSAWPHETRDSAGYLLWATVIIILPMSFAINLFILSGFFGELSKPEISLAISTFIPLILSVAGVVSLLWALASGQLRNMEEVKHRMLARQFELEKDFQLYFVTWW